MYSLPGSLGSPVFSLLGNWYSPVYSCAWACPRSTPRPMVHGPCPLSIVHCSWSMSVSTVYSTVHVHGACPWCTSMSMVHAQVNNACSCPWCMSMSKVHVHVHVSMLHVCVHAACLCPFCIHASCLCPCCMSMSMLYVYVHAECLCPCCMSMSMLHSMPCYMSMLTSILHSVKFFSGRKVNGNQIIKKVNFTLRLRLTNWFFHSLETSPMANW
jgi:hypothetical protein